ncbi:MAG: 2TM domain-containing protein [Alphaproteobacteria bacterium]
MPFTPLYGAGGQGRGEPTLRRHMLIFFVVAGLLLAFNLVTGIAWWLFWPVAAWSLVLTAHWLYVRTINIDDDWVEERTLDIRSNAYDFGHIGAIEDHHKDKMDKDPKPPV